MSCEWSRCMLEKKQPATPEEIELGPQNEMERFLLLRFRQLEPRVQRDMLSLIEAIALTPR